MFYLRVKLVPFLPSPSPSGRPTGNFSVQTLSAENCQIASSHICFMPSLGRRKQLVPSSSHQTGQRSRKEVCGYIQGTGSQGTGSKIPTPLQKCGLFLSPCFGNALLGVGSVGGGVSTIPTCCIRFCIPPKAACESSLLLH